MVYGMNSGCIMVKRKFLFLCKLQVRKSFQKNKRLLTESLLNDRSKCHNETNCILTRIHSVERGICPIAICYVVLCYDVIASC